jgi:hypothetical protein
MASQLGSDPVESAFSPSTQVGKYLHISAPFGNAFSLLGACRLELKGRLVRLIHTPQHPFSAPVLCINLRLQVIGYNM